MRTSEEVLRSLLALNPTNPELHQLLALTVARSTATRAPVLTQAKAQVVELERHLAGCNHIAECSCTGAPARSLFVKKIVEALPAHHEALTLVDLGSGEMKQSFRNCLALFQAGVKKIHMITIDPEFLVFDRWDECIDIYIEPTQFGPVARYAKMNQITGRAIILKNEVLYDVVLGTIPAMGLNLSNDYYLKNNEGGNPLAALRAAINPETDLDANGKLKVTEANRGLINHFLKVYLEFTMVTKRRGEAILSEVETVRGRINQAKGEQALTISRFTTVFSYFLACHPDRAAIMADKERFNQSLRAFNKDFPFSTPPELSEGILYVACATDQGRNAAVINQPACLAADLAVSIDLEDFRAEHDTSNRLEQDCMAGILGATLVVRPQGPRTKVISMQKIPGRGDRYNMESPLTPESSVIDQLSRGLGQGLY